MFDDPTVFPLKSCQIIDMPKFQRKSIFNLYVTGILWRTAQWTIRAPDEYYTQGWKEVFQSIKSCKVKRLILDLNQRPTILKHIVNIHFKELKELWLHGNFIESIEPLEFINADKLVSLSLSENHISNVNALAKCKFSDLSHLYLEKNKFLKFDKLERSTFKKILTLVLEWQKKDSVIIEDASVLCKILMQKKGSIRIFLIQQKGINGKERIFQEKVYDSLNKGFDECTILVSADIMRRQ